MDQKFHNVYTIRKILKKHQFNLLEEMIQNVYPQLSAREQAGVILQLLPYIYTKPLPKKLSAKKQKSVLKDLPSKKEVAPPIEDVEVPLALPASKSTLPLEQLLKLAKMNPQK